MSSSAPSATARTAADLSNPWVFANVKPPPTDRGGPKLGAADQPDRIVPIRAEFAYLEIPLSIGLGPDH